MALPKSRRLRPGPWVEIVALTNELPAPVDGTSGVELETTVFANLPNPDDPPVQLRVRLFTDSATAVTLENVRFEVYDVSEDAWDATVAVGAGTTVVFPEVVIKAARGAQFLLECPVQGRFTVSAEGITGLGGGDGVGVKAAYIDEVVR